MRTASVIVVSNGRPEALRRCLTGIAQLWYPAFEIVVVADTTAADLLSNSAWADKIKLRKFDNANISEARNLGLAAAAGDIVAFIDDDSVPEPTWLSALMAAFEDPETDAAGGFVRGRNGISWQWQAGTIDEGGRRHPLSLDGDKTVVLHPAHGRAIKTEGTNMAFRREIIAAMGGFDPAFRFYLDESDLNMRMAAEGHATALVPGAEVHHGFAASARRRQDRVPRDLFEIGASYAAFLLRHSPEADHPAHRAGFADEQRKRLLGHMVAGRLLPGDVRKLMSRLHDGFAEGQLRKPVSRAALPRAAEGFLPASHQGAPESRFLAGRWFSRRSLWRKAAQAVASGHVTTLMIFSPTSLFGHVRFRPEGYWEHTGGQFGKMERREPVFKLMTLRKKINQEVARIAQVRGLAQDARKSTGD